MIRLIDIVNAETTLTIYDILKYETTVEKYFDELLLLYNYPTNFKKALIYKILPLSIKYETYDRFLLELNADLIKYQDIINQVYTNTDKYFSGKNQTTTTNTNDGVNTSNRLNTDYADTISEYDINNLTLNHANTAEKNSVVSKNTNNTVSSSESYTFKNITDFKKLIDDILTKIVKKHFSYIL